MTAEERIAQLEQENRELRAKLAEPYQKIAQLAERLQQVEGQLAKDSYNSSKPPSSDGPARQSRSQRKASGKKTGGQTGHAGRTLMQVVTPDEVLPHRPARCVHCQHSLEGVPGQVDERRQVHDLPQWRLLVREHQVEEVRCPSCEHLNRAEFPAGVEAPVQYGPNVRALAVYLHKYQLIPLARTCELLSDLCECQLSEGTLTTWVQCAAAKLNETVEGIAEWLSASRLQHADETGIRIGGKLHWLHVNSTSFLTHLAWHAKRGKLALEAIGIWPRFQGRAMHDRWKSYDHYGCAHSICGAHLLRDCNYVAEQEQQPWAAEMHDLLVSMAVPAAEWRQRGAAAVPAQERDEWVAQYFELLGSGFAAQPLPRAEQVPKPGAGLFRRPFSAIYEQSGLTGSAHGQSATKDRWNLSQRAGGNDLLSHSQLPVHYAEAGPWYAGRSGGCLCRPAFARRLVTFVVTLQHPNVGDTRH